MKELFSVPQNKIFTSEILINKSRFLGFCKYVDNQEKADDFINNIRQQHNDARHVVYAYKLLNLAKVSDDGEPSGTAGKPILNILEMKNLTNIIICVVRYFGGIKLGAGGLLRAYSNTAKEIFEVAPIVKYEPSFVYEIILDYSEYQVFLNKIKDKKVIILESDFTNGAKIKFVASTDENFTNAIKIDEILQSYEGI